MDADWGPEVGYRRYVGPAGEYDVMGALQFAVLFSLGLREEHRLCDVGCGSLRGGRLFIPYLASEHYFGVEPNEWLLAEGIAQNVGADLVALRRPTFDHFDDFGLERFATQFDFVLAQSILSHTYADLTTTLLRHVRPALAEGGTLVATFQRRRTSRSSRFLPTPHAGSGWLYPGVVGYRWNELERLLADADLAGVILPFHHPRQTWFAAVPRAESERLGALRHAARHALAATTDAERVKRRLIAQARQLLQRRDQ